jgi:hypothetical protein
MEANVPVEPRVFLQALDSNRLGKPVDNWTYPLFLLDFFRHHFSTLGDSEIID